jgi:predicted lipoprotein with Yx(FWY)xxD motif
MDRHAARRNEKERKLPRRISTAGKRPAYYCAETPRIDRRREGAMGLRKRVWIAAGAAAAAGLGSAGCAPAGFNAADYGGGVQPAANAAAEPADAGGKEALKLTAEQTTDRLTGTRVPRMGAVIEDEGGWVLYRFDKDTAKPQPASACAGDCAKVWLPALTNDGKPRLTGVNPELVGTVTRADGTRQLTVAGWSLYRYVGDKKPGTWRGQNVNGAWFVIKPSGRKNLTCVPPVSKPVAPPADAAADAATAADQAKPPAPAPADTGQPADNAPVDTGPAIGY